MFASCGMTYSDRVAAGLAEAAAGGRGAIAGGFLAGAGDILRANRHLRKLETPWPDASASRRTRSTIQQHLRLKLPRTGSAARPAPLYFESNRLTSEVLTRPRQLTGGKNRISELRPTKIGNLPVPFSPVYRRSCVWLGDASCGSAPAKMGQDNRTGQVETKADPRFSVAI